MYFASEIYKKPFKFTFFLLFIFYLIAYAPYGLEDGDMGSIFGISWSMYNGYFPYRDFVYIKPPFSPYFHSWPLYLSENYGYLINRGFYYVQVFTYSYLASILLFRAFQISRKDWIFYVATLGALLSVHNYAPMPWNTVDGIFFSVIGLYFLCKTNLKTYHIILGALFISIGVLCKQSFFFFPVLISLYFLLKKEYKLVISFITSGLLLAGIFIAILYSQDALTQFLEQIFSFTPGSGLLKTGVKSYYLSIKFNFLFILGFALVIFLTKRFLPPKFAHATPLIIIAGIFIYVFAIYHAYYVVRFGVIHVTFVSCVLFALFKLRKDKSYSFVLLMLGLSWCASISNGFNTPIDFSTPFIFCILLFYFNTQIEVPKLVGLGLIVLFSVTFFYGYQYPYRDSPRSELTYHMGDVFPRLTGVQSDKETYSKYKELLDLSKEYDNFTILPSVTLGHYLTNTLNPIGVDWVFNHHLSDQIEAYITKLEDENITVFMENFEGHVDDYEESSILTVHVRDHWKLLKETDYFRVYQKP